MEEALTSKERIAFLSLVHDGALKDKAPAGLIFYDFVAQCDSLVNKGFVNICWGEGKTVQRVVITPKGAGCFADYEDRMNQELDCLIFDVLSKCPEGLLNTDKKGVDPITYRPGFEKYTEPEINKRLITLKKKQLIELEFFEDHAVKIRLEDAGRIWYRENYLNNHVKNNESVSPKEIEELNKTINELRSENIELKNTIENLESLVKMETADFDHNGKPYSKDCNWYLKKIQFNFLLKLFAMAGIDININGNKTKLAIIIRNLLHYPNSISSVQKYICPKEHRLDSSTHTDPVGEINTIMELLSKPVNIEVCRRSDAMYSTTIPKLKWDDIVKKY